MPKLLLQLWRWLWPSPWTLVGLLLAAAILAAGGQARWRHGAIECYGGLLGRWARYQRFAAITLGHVILARNARDARRWAAHERVHVHQYERWGLLFVPAYLVAGAWQGLRGHSPYTDNPFEKEAHSK